MNHEDNQQIERLVDKLTPHLEDYLVKHGIRSSDKIINIFQGKYINRPSIITTRYVTNNENQVNIEIEGEVSFFATGRLSLS